jgi:hypothetical protein
MGDADDIAVQVGFKDSSATGGGWILSAEMPQGPKSPVPELNSSGQAGSVSLIQIVNSNGNRPPHPLPICLSASSSVLSVIMLPLPDSFSTSFDPLKPICVEIINSSFLYPVPFTDDFHTCNWRHWICSQELLSKLGERLVF